VLFSDVFHRPLSLPQEWVVLQTYVVVVVMACCVVRVERTKGLVQMFSPKYKKSSCLVGKKKGAETYHHSMLSVMSATTTFGLSSADKVTVLEKRATAIRVNGAILPMDCLVNACNIVGRGWMGRGEIEDATRGPCPSALAIFIARPQQLSPTTTDQPEFLR